MLLLGDRGNVSYKQIIKESSIQVCVQPYQGPRSKAFFGKGLSGGAVASGGGGGGGDGLGSMAVASVARVFVADEPDHSVYVYDEERNKKGKEEL